MKDIKKLPTSQENIDKIKNLQHQLDNMLFIDDIVNIKVMTKKEYREIARTGFDLNGKHYVRFMVGSGQMRRNTVSFINEELYHPTIPYCSAELIFRAIYADKSHDIKMMIFCGLGHFQHK